MRTLSLLPILLSCMAWGQAPSVPSKPEPIKTFHNCTSIGGSANSPHLFDESEIYQCDEGKIEIAGRRRMTIEGGYMYETEMGKPSAERPHIATEWDYLNYKWCPGPRGTKEMCGDKPTTCFDKKPATWDPNWQGFSCATPDHK